MIRVRVREVRTAVMLIAIAALAGAAPSSLLAQATGTIRGRVLEARSQRPMSDVRVAVVGSSLGGVTGANGAFVISNVPAGSRALRAQLIGYRPGEQTVDVPAGGTVQADFTLDPAAVQLNEIVVTGSAVATERRALGNAVTTLDVADLASKSTVTNVTELLQSKTPGVSILPNSGAPGTAAEIRIRGAGSLSGASPVVFIDGIRYNTQGLGNFNPTGAGLAGQAQAAQVTSALNFISPQDIESIEVIKGPAAATLYGADAAAGVIQIITKKGIQGEQSVRWSARYERGQSDWAVDSPVNYTTCDAAKQALAVAAQWPGCQGVPENTILVQEPLRDDPQALRDGTIDKVGISARGGGERYSYYLSAERDNEQGVFQNSYSNRKSLRGNFTLAPNARTDVTVMMGYIRGDLRLPYQDESAGSLLLSATRGWPGHVRLDTTGWGTTIPERSNLYNNTTRSDRFTLGSTVTFRPIEWFTNRFTAGLDFTSSLAQLVSGPGQDDAQGYSAQRAPRAYVYTIDYAATVRRPLPWELESTTSLGVQAVAERNERLDATGTGLASPDVTVIGSATTTSGFNTYSENNSLGYYAEEQIAWRNRLYVTLGLRADDHSAFGEEFNLSIYPKVSLSWVLSEEPAFQNLAATLRLDEFRLRTAWGRAGRAPNAFSATQTYAIQRVTHGGQTVLGLQPLSPGNPELKPEMGEEIEVGFDAGLWNGRLNFDVTYYNKVTSDMLVGVPPAPSSGFTASYLDNVGKVTNSGFEVGVTGTVLDLDDVRWDSRLTLATNDNELVSFGVPGVTSQAISGQSYTPGYQVNREGYPLGGYWLARPELDANGELQWNTAGTAILLTGTTEYLGTPTPTREIGFSNTLTLFRNVRLYALFDYKGGHKMQNYKEYNRCAIQGNCARLNDPALRFGTTRADSLERAYWRTPYAYLEDASFVKLRDLSLTYDLPLDLVGRMGLSTASVTLAGHNLAIWSDYTGYDPEVNSYGNRLFARADVYAAPMMRRLTMSVNLGY
jgi:TonB-linked SusC/RagA family outer membrane protein